MNVRAYLVCDGVHIVVGYPIGEAPAGGPGGVRHHGLIHVVIEGFPEAGVVEVATYLQPGT